jgi:basic amino acid/polyamine antiporter, APA family
VHPPSTASAPAPGLRRALGKWDLSAIGINQVIGGAVFAMPATVAAYSGRWSPILVVLVGGASLLIAATFAEVGSRFDATGGPYLYARAAFGRFIAFEVGWMQWFTRVASWATVVNIFVASLGFYWPALTSGAQNTAFLTAIIAALAIINILGIRQSALAVNLLTIGKLLPLAIFIAVGLFVVEPARLRPEGSLTFQQTSAAALFLIYAFGGYEVVPVVAGETKDPRGAVPFALITTIVVVTAILTLAQVVALSILPGLVSSKTPLADAASVLMGPAGAALITVGAVMSTMGNNMGSALSGSRNLFALAEQGDLPAFFGHVHPRFRTPVNAIVVTAIVTLAIAATGTFVTTAAASAISRLVVYVATAASAVRLRHASVAERVESPRFVLPFGPFIPSVAILVTLAILAGASSAQLAAGGAALAAGAILFFASAPRTGASRRGDNVIHTVEH